MKGVEAGLGGAGDRECGACVSTRTGTSRFKSLPKGFRLRKRLSHLGSLLDEEVGAAGDDPGGPSKSEGAVKPEQALPGFLRPLARLVRRPSRDASFGELICDPPESSPRRTTYGQQRNPLPRRAGADRRLLLERKPCQSRRLASRSDLRSHSPFTSETEGTRPRATLVRALAPSDRRFRVRACAIRSQPHPPREEVVRA
jgi:hypothetical protein